MKILDRYVLQKFLLPFIYCIFGFIAIWFIFDLSDNLPDFLQGKVGLPTLVVYYKSQIPQIIVIALPIGCLLALLYSLTAMSRTNELISMLGAGKSVFRVLIPLFLVGLLLVGITGYFNYDQAPQAELKKKQMLREIKQKKKFRATLSGHLYRNREDARTWFMRSIDKDQQRLIDVQVVQQDKTTNDITREWYAREAIYDPFTKRWALHNAKYIEMTPNGDITKTKIGEITVTEWSETPWRIASSVMKADYLSVPELRDYLSYNKDFPERRLAAYRTHLEYRWALPWTCVLVVLLAAPFGIVYNRRGILGGVAIAIGLFFSFVFISSLFIALGTGDRISPFTAAWGPLIFFGIIGVILLWYRSTNRDLPKFKFPWLS